MHYCKKNAQPDVSVDVCAHSAEENPSLDETIISKKICQRQLRDSLRIREQINSHLADIQQRLESAGERRGGVKGESGEERALGLDALTQGSIRARLGPLGGKGDMRTASGAPLA